MVGNEFIFIGRSNENITKRLPLFRKILNLLYLSEIHISCYYRIVNELVYIRSCRCRDVIRQWIIVRRGVANADVYVLVPVVVDAGVEIAPEGKEHAVDGGRRATEIDLRIGGKKNLK